MRFRGVKAGRGPISALLGFRRAQEGATAVEFALVVGPFLFALLATMEVAMVMWTSEVLEKAVATAARKIYTGEFQNDAANTNLTASQLQAKVQSSVCAEVTALIKCSDIAVDVRSFGSFGSAAPANPVNAKKGYDPSSFGYQTVGTKQIGLVTASMEYKTFFPPLAIGSLANGNRLIMATAVFRAEPYQN